MRGASWWGTPPVRSARSPWPPTSPSAHRTPARARTRLGVPRGIGESWQNRLLAPIVLSGLVGWVLRRPKARRAFARTVFGNRPDPQHVELARRLMASPPAHQVQAPKAVAELRPHRPFRRRQSADAARARRARPQRDSAHTQALLHELPHARLITYEGAGHILVLERAARLAEDIDAFARDVTANVS